MRAVIPQLSRISNFAPADINAKLVLYCPIQEAHIRAVPSSKDLLLAKMS